MCIEKTKTLKMPGEVEFKFDLEFQFWIAQANAGAQIFLRMWFESTLDIKVYFISIKVYFSPFKIANTKLKQRSPF